MGFALQFIESPDLYLPEIDGGSLTDRCDSYNAFAAEAHVYEDDSGA